MAYDSLVGGSVHVGERCSIKRSIVGAHCSIGSNVKLTNVVLMDHVTVHDGYATAPTLSTPRRNGGAATLMRACPGLLARPSRSVRLRCKLENVVVGSLATVKADCTLKDCQVGYGVLVAAGRTLSWRRALGWAGRRQSLRG